MSRKKIIAFCVAAPYSGSGKTTFTLGIIKALRNRGFSIQPFKCGPDYIDTSYLSAISGRSARNLDVWMMGKKGMIDSFSKNTQGADAV